MSNRSRARLLALTLALFPATARAFTNDTAGLALHLIPATGVGHCTSANLPPVCSNIVTRGNLSHPYYAYLLVTHADATQGVAGLACGIRYNSGRNRGVDIFDWYVCATLEFAGAGWPASETGTLITWDSTNKCQRFEPGGPGTGVVAVAGYFYLSAYSADRMDVIPRPIDGMARVGDCSSQDYVLEGPGVHRVPSPLGALVFSDGGGLPGYSPCGQAGTGTCPIGGPTSVETGATGLIFSVIGATPGDAFAWTISGNGVIVGPTNAAQVTVTAGAIGTFQLGLDWTHAGATTTCSTIVEVTPLTCLIQGPLEVIEGSEGVHYSVARITPAEGIHWSITGNGVITSGANDTDVTVTATTPGAFFLSVASDGNTTACQRAIAVTAVPCTITGPDQVPGHQVNLEYAAQYQLPGSTYAWTISGEGTLTGALGGPTVRVTAGNPGAFTLHLTLTRSGSAHNCNRSITVVDAGHCAASQADAKILVHLKPTTTRNACGTWGEPACADVNTAGALYPTTYFGYLLVCNGSALAGVAGAECGISYDSSPHSGVDIYTWSLCSTAEFRTADWPASGSGNRITWDPTTTCRRHEPGGPGTGVTANAGYFYLAAYTPDQLAIRPHPATGEAKVADCTACESVIATAADGLYPNLGNATFSAGGNSAGYNPCGSVVPVVQTTWGSIKAFFKGGTSQK